MNKPQPKLSVFIVERQEELRTGLTQILTRAGYDVQSVASHGEARTELLKANCQPDVVLLSSFSGQGRADAKKPELFSGECFLRRGADQNIPCVAIVKTDKEKKALTNVKGRGDGAVGTIDRDVLARAVKFEGKSGKGENTTKLLYEIADAIGKKQAKGRGV